MCIRDRTFNLKVDASVRILQFFLDRLPAPGLADPKGNLFVHFEVIPDHLPDRLKAMIAQFPPGTMQLEVGVQSFNVQVQERIARKQDNAKTEANLRWLVHHSKAHLHADLIFGLPGETLESFANGFDRLHALGPHEIQLGVLKRLRGTPIARHTQEHGMVYDSSAPYTVQQTGVVDAQAMQRFVRFARYWDLVANSGRFKQTLKLLMGGPVPTQLLASGSPHSPFAAFSGFADGLWQTSASTSGLTPEQLVDALFDHLCARGDVPPATVRSALLADYLASGARGGSPRALQGSLSRRARQAHVPAADSLSQRQQRHL